MVTIAARRSDRTTAGLQALLVTFLWSTSFILTKWIFTIGGLGPLWLNALRYGSAAVVLLGYRALIKAPPWRTVLADRPGLLWQMIGLGIINYTIAQGGVTLGLKLLPSTHVALLLNLNNPVQVILFSALLLREMPIGIQSAGLGMGLVGAIAFYYPLTSPPGGWLGALPVIVCGVGYAITTIYTRSLMRDGTVGALDLTVVSMVAGSLGMMLPAWAVEGLPILTAATAAYVGWLAVVNTAVAFTLWAHTQKVLALFETTTINNTMLVQIALLSWLLLGDPLRGLKLPAILLVAAGTFLVQAGPRLGRAR